MKFGKLKFAAAAALTAFIAVVGTSMSAHAATGAGGITILHASNGDMAHQCTVIGEVDGYQGVVCADLLTGLLGSQYWVEGRVEAYCQTDAGVEVQCADVDLLYGEMADGGGGNTLIGGTQCGHSYGPCSTGRNYAYSRSNFYYDTSTYPVSCSSSTGSITQVWAVAAGGVVGIELPKSDKWVYLSTANSNDGGNESTGHYYICP